MASGPRIDGTEEETGPGARTGALALLLVAMALAGCYESTGASCDDCDAGAGAGEPCVLRDGVCEGTGSGRCSGPFRAYRYDEGEGCVEAEPWIEDCYHGMASGSLIISCYVFHTPDGDVIATSPATLPSGFSDYAFTPCEHALASRVTGAPRCD